MVCVIEVHMLLYFLHPEALSGTVCCFSVGYPSHREWLGSNGGLTGRCFQVPCDDADSTGQI